MKINVTMIAARVSERVLRGGEKSGQTVYSLTVWVHTGDNIPTDMVIYDLGSRAAAESLAAKLTAGRHYQLEYVPRDPIYIDRQDLREVAAENKTVK